MWVIVLAAVVLIVGLRVLGAGQLVSNPPFCPEGLWQLAILLGWGALLLPGHKLFTWLLEKAPRGIISYAIFFLAILAIVAYGFGVMVIQQWFYECHYVGG